MVCQADMPGNEMLDFITFFFGFLFACFWGAFFVYFHYFKMLCSNHVQIKVYLQLVFMH